MAHHQPKGLIVRITPTSILAPLLTCALLLGCDRQPAEPDPALQERLGKTEEHLGQVDPLQEQATLDAWEQGSRWIAAAQEQCGQMHQAIEAFLSGPNAQTQADAQDHWHRCHDQWHQLDPLLALSKSNPGLFGPLEHISFSVDAHPLQPGYLDSIEGYPYSGIVNDTTLNINASNLREQHGLTDHSDVALGLHALEFLLWGEHGERPVSDYESEYELTEEQREAELTVDKLPNNRRRDLLRLLSHLLQDDLEQAQQRWRGEHSNLWLTYRQLHPQSRLQLLKNAGHQLLERELVGEIQALSHPERVHNRFAGQSLRPVASALKGLEQLMTQGEPALTEWLGEPETASQWQRQVADLITTLEAILAGQASEEEAEPEALIQQLQLLAVFLQPVAELSRND